MGWREPEDKGRVTTIDGLLVLVASVGLGLPTSALAQARRRAGRLVIAVIVPILLLPLIAWAASRIVPPGPLRLGVLATGVAPTEVASVALTALAGGSAALAASVLAGSTVVSVVLAGPVLNLLAGGQAGFSGVSLLLSLLRVVLLPLALAAAVRFRLPDRWRAGAEGLSSLGGSVAVLTLIWLVAGQAHLGSAYVRAALALQLFLLGSTLVGALVSVRLPRAAAVSLLLPVAMRDFAIAAGIATQAFGPAAAGALGLYGVFVLLFGAGVARLPHGGSGR